MEMMNREYLLLSPASNNSVGAIHDELSLGDEVSGVTPCNAVSLKGMRGKQAIIGRRSRLRVPLPEVSKAVLLYDELDENEKWTLYPCNPAGDEALKVFVCSGMKGSGPVGIRTSWDWNHTFWGTEVDKIPGCWIVPCSVLKEGHLEYKIVSGSDENLNWEPSPYENKSVMINNKTQLISGSWASNTVTAHDITLYSQHLTVSFSPSPSTEAILQDNPGSLIVLTNCKDHDNNLIFPKGEHTPMSWSGTYQAYTVTLRVSGHLTKVSFGMAILDHSEYITHIANRSYNKDKSQRRWEIYPGKDISILNEDFTDVRPRWQRHSNQSLMTSPLQSVDNTPSAPDSICMPSAPNSTPSALDSTPSAPDGTPSAPNSTSSLHSSGSKTLPPGLHMAAGDHFSGQQQKIHKTLSKTDSFTKTLSRVFSLKKIMKKVRDTSNLHIGDIGDNHGIKGATYSPHRRTPLQKTSSNRKLSTV